MLQGDHRVDRADIFQTCSFSWIHWIGISTAGVPAGQVAPRVRASGEIHVELHIRQQMVSNGKMARTGVSTLALLGPFPPLGMG